MNSSTPEHRLLFSCEHAGNAVPARYREAFAAARELLDTHAGYDIGAAALARLLARRCAAPLHESRVTRLLVDLNRSIGHPRQFSVVSRAFTAAERRRILKRHYLPYRHAVQARVDAAIARGRTLVHVSVHSFTPYLAGVERRADIALLYDPGRCRESALCRSWAAAMRRQMPELRIRRNYPYRGTSDGFTAYLRGAFPAARYLGVELEVNQTLLTRGSRAARATGMKICEALHDALNEL